MIVGLGNPGEKYTQTYHNAGRLSIDFLAKKLVGQGRFETEPLFSFVRRDGLFLARTETYMNESGEAVRAAIKYFSRKDKPIKPEEVLIIQDDSDLFLGHSKLCFDRGSAGHKGIESIVAHLRTRNFWRLRLGIRQKAGVKAEDFVLRKIKPADRKKIEATLESFWKDSGLELKLEA